MLSRRIGRRMAAGSAIPGRSREPDTSRPHARARRKRQQRNGGECGCRRHMRGTAATAARSVSRASARPGQHRAESHVQQSRHTRSARTFSPPPLPAASPEPRRRGRRHPGTSRSTRRQTRAGRDSSPAATASARRRAARHPPRRWREDGQRPHAEDGNAGLELVREQRHDERLRREPTGRCRAAAAETPDAQTVS